MVVGLVRSWVWCGGEVVWRRGAGSVSASAETFGPKRSIALLFRDEPWKPKHNLWLHKQGFATRSRLETDHREFEARPGGDPRRHIATDRLRQLITFDIRTVAPSRDLTHKKTMFGSEEVKKNS